MKKLTDEALKKLSQHMFNFSIEAIPQNEWDTLNKHRIDGVDFEEALTNAISDVVSDYHKAGSKTMFSVIADLFRSGRKDFLAKVADS